MSRYLERAIEDLQVMATDLDMLSTTTEDTRLRRAVLDAVRHIDKARELLEETKP